MLYDISHMTPASGSPQWRFFLTSAEAWRAMYDDCRKAVRSIDIEEYIFLNDAAGHPLFDILEEKARQGVTVRLILDSAGSFSVARSPLLSRLRQAGVQVWEFNPIGAHRLHRIRAWFFRDHRKMLVVDGEVAHIGGVCLQANMADWRDTQLRITGNVVAEFTRAFEEMWTRHVSSKRVPLTRSEFSAEGFQLLANAPRLHQRRLYHELLRRIKAAKKRIYITTPYFIPSARFFRRLRNAARRKVDVRVLTANKSDHTFVDRASDFHMDALLRSGARAYRYMPSILHAKGAIMDDWATIGSANIDNLSFLFNHEANLASVHPDFVRDMELMFQEDIRASKELSLKEWRRRPLLAKVLEAITWPFHRLL